MKKLWLIVILVCVGICVHAQSFVVDGIAYQVLRGRQVDITHTTTPPAAELHLPSTVTHQGRSYRVTAIGTNAFMGCPTLRIIHLPEGLRLIGSEAFLGCPDLQEVYIPHSVKNIEIEAFSCCAKLHTITLPKGLKCLEYKVLFGCLSLHELRLPAGLRRIEDGALAGCPAAKNIHIPTTVKHIAPEAFGYAE